MQTFSIKKSLARIVKIYRKGDAAVPQELFSAKSEKPDLSGVKYPLPSGKNGYTCFVKAGDALWLGAPNGITRYNPAEENEVDRVMYFSASRELEDNCVKALWCDGTAPENVWALTETAVSHIVLKNISAEEKAERITEETLKYVSRRGMVTQRQLTVAREHESRVPYGHSDNSGCFTAAFAVGELCKYAVYREKYGREDARTAAARESAMKATEACQLLMYISGRGDGFVARTYMVASEPVPDDGLYYRKENGKAVCLPTSYAKKKGLAGTVIDASHPVPERLARLYESEGHSSEGIVYKGDTSSDEITLHYLLIYFAHEILGAEDAELDGLLQNSAKATLRHILTHGNELYECNGKPTTWAKWSLEYFKSVLGWSDGCLNAAELLMYLKIVMHVTGETGEWLEAYNRLIDEGYAKLSTLHDSRFHVSAQISSMEQVEELMYGDNMLATAAYWMLITLEKDEKLKNMYKEGYKAWNSTFRREHNPAYDFPYMLSCPEDEIDTARLSDWFRRQNVSRLASSTSLETRLDVPLRYRYGGTRETSWLLPPDEMFIAKYDRNPYDFTGTQNRDGLYVIESGYVYTFAYWLGRYSGFIKEEE